MNNLNKFFIKIFGCQMNFYDGDLISRLMKKELNLIQTSVQDEADIIIFITCSIREKAKEKLFSEIGRIKKIKNNKNLIICVGGCVSTQENEKLFKRCSLIDVVFGPQTLHKLPRMCIEYINSNKSKQIDTSFPNLEKFNHIPKKYNKEQTQFITITEGCNNFCSYCIVPFTRGREISRPYKSIMNEISELPKINHQEIILLGQNVNNYNGINYNNKNSIDLIYLIEMISKLDYIEKIQFLTAHPRTFTDEFIEMYKFFNKLNPRLHLPVQSGSDKILKLMNRGYTISDYKDKIFKLRKINPEIIITTDFIVGFPGETDDDFQKTINLVKEIKFGHSFSFMYSPRPLTKSEKLDDLPINIKKKRIHILQKELSENNNE